MSKPQRRRRGVHRPTKLTTEVSEAVKKALFYGAFRKTAALWAGISYTTLREWMAYGKERPTSEYGKFRRMVIEEETKAEVHVGRVFLKAALENPKYAKEWLKLRHRKRWSPPQTVELTGKDGGPIEWERTLAGMTDEELEAVERIYAAAAARQGAEGEGAA